MQCNEKSTYLDPPQPIDVQGIICTFIDVQGIICTFIDVQGIICTFVQYLASLARSVAKLPGYAAF